LNRIVFSIALFLFTFLAVGQTASKQELKYKPKNLDEAILQLTKIHDDSTKNAIKLMTENEFLSRAHMSLGMWIRNNWRLWKGGELADYFHSIGIFHPDDMSGIILTSYHRTLNNKDIDLNGQVRQYQAYERASQEHMYKLKTDTSYQRQVKERNDSLIASQMQQKKGSLTPGTAVYGYVNYRRGLLDLGNRTQVKGTVVSWSGDTMTIHVTEYVDKKKRKAVIRRYDIHNDLLTISDLDYFHRQK
jgi:hypothetical protein